MQELQIFKNEQFGSVRALEIDGEPWLVGKDVADVLGYSNTRKALTDHVDDEDKLDGVTIRDSIGREQSPIFINESGVYSLILRSQLPAAKQFKRWITSEVLPSLRKTGGYVVGQEQMSGEELMAAALNWANAKIEEQKQRIAEMRPKEIFADAVSTSDSCILIGELAKLITQNGVPIGQNRLFKWMRENRYLMASNIPTQRAMDMGLFEICERTITDPDGRVRITSTTKVTGKGQQYFVNKFLK